MNSWKATASWTPILWVVSSSQNALKAPKVSQLQIKTRSQQKTKAIKKAQDGDEAESSPELQASGKFFSEGCWFNTNDKVSTVYADKGYSMSFNSEIFKINDQVILKHLDMSKKEWKSGYIDELDNDEILIVDQHGIGESIYVEDIYYIERV